MKHRMTIEYLKCRAYLNLEVDYRVNSTIATKWDLIFGGKWYIVSIIYIFFSNPTNMLLRICGTKSDTFATNHVFLDNRKKTTLVRTERVLIYYKCFSHYIKKKTSNTIPYHTEII